MYFGQRTVDLLPFSFFCSAAMFIKNHDTGKILNYKVYNPNPEKPCGFDEKIRYDAVGVSFNKITAEIVKSPHVHDPNTPGGVREANPDEIPG